MRGVIMHSPGDVEVIDRDDSTIEQPTDAVIRVTGTCICGSDLHPYHGVQEADEKLMGHEYVGVVEAIGAEVTSVAVGDHVVGSFAWSDNTCEICSSGFHSRCVNGGFFDQGIGTQAEMARVPQADGTLVRLPSEPTDEQLRHALAASDVLGTGWYGAVAADVGPGRSVAVVGDGAVGLLAVLAARELGAEQIIAMSKYPDRQALAREFGATHVVEERGDEGAEAVKELTGGLGAHSVIEAVGNQQSFMQAIGATRPGGSLGFVGVANEVQIPGIVLFFASIKSQGGPAPVRRFLPDLIDRIWSGAIEPGKVFDTVLPLDEAAEGYRLMDEREAIKVMLSV